MKLACTYITRRCPRNCSYCDASKVRKEEELDWLDWVRVNGILRELGVSFNLILGNESWLLGKKLKRIMEVNTVPYALYTTAPPELFITYRDLYFRSGAIDNLSCGLDHSLSHLEKNHSSDIEKKSINAWQAFEYVKEVYPHIDCQGTVTINKHNFKQLPEIVEDLSKMKVFIGVNMIHYNKDGKFDFFPNAFDLMQEGFLFNKNDSNDLREVFHKCYTNPDALIQNKEMLNPLLVDKMIDTNWHCRGNPYNGPTIDSDGSLRCCGYRKGERASQYHIFEMPKKFQFYLKAVEADALECPGCFWSYPWMAAYWKTRNIKFGKKVFVQHARPELSEDKWSKRKIE